MRDRNYHTKWVINILTNFIEVKFGSALSKYFLPTTSMNPVPQML